MEAIYKQLHRQLTNNWGNPWFMSLLRGTNYVGEVIISKHIQYYKLN